MKKKVLSVLAALMVMTMGTTVFAADSPDASSVTDVKENEAQKAEVEAPEAKTAAEYVAAVKVEGATVEAVSEATVAATVEEIKSLLKDVDAVATVISSDELKTAAVDTAKKIVPEIKTVVEVSAPAGVTVSKENPISLTFEVAGIKAGSNILVLHWNGTAWETIKPESVADGKITASFTSLSPIAIVELSVESAAGSQTSPSTGEAASVLPVLAVICMAGAVVCGKKVAFNN